MGVEKYFFNVEIRDREGEDTDEAFLSFPAHSDFVMWGPNEFDRAFMRNPIAHWMSREIDEVERWSPRTEFVECFLRDSAGTGPLTMNDYWGVYVLMERNERGNGRLDVERLSEVDNTSPRLTGGYIVKRDRIEAGDVGMTTGGHNNWVFSYPQNPTAEQFNYLSSLSPADVRLARLLHR